MKRRSQKQLRAGRFVKPFQPSTTAFGKQKKHGIPSGKRARGATNVKLPFSPPEDWHEPVDEQQGYRFVVQEPGEGYRHVLTPDEVRQRLSLLPAEFVEQLQVVQFSQITRKKLSFPCYGMQWGNAIYLYPIETNLTEYYPQPPKPNQVNEARMYGGRWSQHAPGIWKLEWTLETIKDYYLNNILIHELGHLIDERNSTYQDRERYAEAFAIEYGYRVSRRRDPSQVVRRHRAS